jgi:hypothetical protein
MRVPPSQVGSSSEYAANVSQEFRTMFLQEQFFSP